MPGWIVIILFIFIPFTSLRFHLFYSNHGVDDEFLLEMSYLKIFRWRQRVTLIKPRLEKWGFIANLEKEQEIPTAQKKEHVQDIWRIQKIFTSIKDLNRRLEAYGLGVTLLSLFLPDKYKKYLTVVEELEDSGKFTRFKWETTIGVTDAAQTAIGLGVIWGVVGHLTAFLQNRYQFRCQPMLNVLPSFGHNVLDTCFDCIFKLKIGYIMLVGFRELGRRWKWSGRENNHA